MALNIAQQFKLAKTIAKTTVQFECDACRHVWWGDKHETMCDQCDHDGTVLDKRDTVGLGWFKCDCNRMFAGYCRGNMSSQCHQCKQDVWPSYVVPDDAFKGPDAGKNNKHQCAACHGRGVCPIVEAAKQARLK
jgi:hypothetical protein